MIGYPSELYYPIRLKNFGPYSLEGLKEGISDDPESMDFYCDVIIDEAGKMNNMVKKLLTLNQIEFGNEELVMERFDIIELITEYYGESIPIFDSRIPFSVKAAETSAAGVSIFSLDKKHPVAGAYEELTKEVLAHE